MDRYTAVLVILVTFFVALSILILLTPHLGWLGKTIAMLALTIVTLQWGVLNERRANARNE